MAVGKSPGVLKSVVALVGPFPILSLGFSRGRGERLDGESTASRAAGARVLGGGEKSSAWGREIQRVHAWVSELGWDSISAAANDEKSAAEIAARDDEKLDRCGIDNATERRRSSTAKSAPRPRAESSPSGERHPHASGAGGWAAESDAAASFLGGFSTAIEGKLTHQPLFLNEFLHEFHMDTAHGSHAPMLCFLGPMGHRLTASIYQIQLGSSSRYSAQMHFSRSPAFFLRQPLMSAATAQL